MDLAAWSIETSSAKVKQMPFPVGSLLEICSSDKIYDSMNKKDKPWQYLCCRNVINNKCNIQIMAQNQSYETKMYSLDVIISVGYRVKSINGTKFRIWANSGSTAPMWFCAEFGHKAVIHLM